MRQVLSLAMFSAVPNVCLIYSNRLGVSVNVVNALSPISILLSLPIMAALMAVLF